MKGEVGEASIITRRSVSPPTASSSSSGPLFPPQENDAPHSSRYLNYPKVIDPEVPPIRPERHVGNSIATMCRVIARAIARTLIRCPCCQQTRMRNNL